MAKEILVLTGSPRRGGNSDRLAEAFIKGAESAGHSVHKFEAAYKNIHGCRACEMCWSTGSDPCVVKDDFYQLVPLIESCDAVIFVSPIYFWGFTAQLKAAWDRFYPYIKEEGKKRTHISECALILALGDTEDATYRHAAGAYKDIVEYIGWKDRGLVVAKGVYKKIDVLQNEALAKAEALGKSL
jgi:multimeric flavodoxin WrbA